MKRAHGCKFQHCKPELKKTTRQFHLSVLPVLVIRVYFSSGLRCYECMNCNDQFNASDAKVKVETCSGRCAKTKRSNCA